MVSFFCNIPDDNTEIKSMIDENGGVGMTTTQSAQLQRIFDAIVNLGFDNIEFKELLSGNQISSGVSGSTTLVTEGVNFDILLVATMYRSSRTNSGDVYISSGYNSLECIDYYLPSSKANCLSMFRLYHIEKDAGTNLTISYKNTGSDYFQLMINAIMFL